MPLSRNLGALTSWNPLGLSRPVMGLIYLFLLFHIHFPICVKLLPSFLQLVVLEDCKFCQNRLSNYIYTCVLKRCTISKVEIALVNSVRYVAEFVTCVVVYLHCTGRVMLQTTNCLLRKVIAFISHYITTSQLLKVGES